MRKRPLLWGGLCLAALPMLIGCGGGNGAANLAGGGNSVRKAELHRFDVNVETGKVTITKVDPENPTRAVITGSAVSFTSSDLIAVAGDAGKRIIRLGAIANLGANESPSGVRLVIGNILNSNTVNLLTSTQVGPYAGDGTAGSTNGLLGVSRFSVPAGVSMGRGGLLGSVIVADYGNHVIRRIAPEGSVTTVAGTAGVAGSVDGLGAAARFNNPYACATDDEGNIYVASYTGNTIQRITPLGQVSRICNPAGGLGDTTGDASQNNMLRNPYGIAVSRDGRYIWISEQGAASGRIRLLSFNNNGSRNDPANYLLSEIASGGRPRQLALGGTGFGFNDSLFFCNTADHSVYRIDNPTSSFSAKVYRIAGTGAAGNADGTGATATFNQPASIAFLKDENNSNRFLLFVGQLATPRLRAIAFNGSDDKENPGNYNVVTLAGDGTASNVDGNGSVARFNQMLGLAAVAGNANAATLYLAQSDNRIRRITFNPATLTSGVFNSGVTEPVRLLIGTEVPNVTPNAYYVTPGFNSTELQFFVPSGVAAFSFTAYLEGDTNYINLPAAGSVFATTLIGQNVAGSGVQGASDGVGKLGQTRNPLGLVVVPSNLRNRYGIGTIRAFITEQTAGRLRYITTDGFIGQFAVAPGTLNNPYGLDIAPDGAVWVCESGAHRIWRFDTNGNGTVVAGTGVAGSADGTGATATFNTPTGISIDNGGNAFITDTTTHIIRRISYFSGSADAAASYRVTTVAGTAGASGSTNGLGAAARFNGPRGVATDTDGTVFVADSGNHTIRILTRDPAGSGTYNVALLSGTAGTAGSADGTGAGATHSTPIALALDTAHNVYVSDFGSNRVRRVSSPSGIVITLAGGSAGFADGQGPQFRNPAGLGVDAFGTLLVSDYNNHAIRTVQRLINNAYPSQN